MLRSITPAHVYADLGNAWFQYQVALIDQRHKQCGGHFLVDVDALLARAAKVARATQITPTNSSLSAAARSGAKVEVPVQVPRMLALAA